MREAGENFVIVDGRPLAEYRQDEHPGRHLLPERRAGAAHRRHRPRPQDQDRRQLRGPHALHHRRADADRFRRSQSGRCAGERHAGLVPGRPGARAWREPALCRTAAAGADAAALEARRAELAAAHGAAFVAPARPTGWLADASRTTYLLDVRTPEEFAAHAVPGFVHAPGGQLIQATDQWVGVAGRAARAARRGAACGRRSWRHGCASSDTRPMCSRAASPRPGQTGGRPPMLASFRPCRR